MRSQRLQQKDHWDKDREILKESESATSQSRTNRGSLKDYSLKHKVSFSYDMSEDSVRDRMFILKVDDYSVILDYEEMSRIGRFV
jgi:hypothetical protein